jgi:hypothetical protein
MMNKIKKPRGDDGTILPLALVVSVVLSAVVLALTSYTFTNLRFGGSVENRADRLSAAEAGMRHVLEQVTDGTLCTTNAGVAGGDIVVPGTISGASVTVNCKQIGGTLSNITSWAVVVTGEGGVPDGDGWITNSGAGKAKAFGGPSYIARPALLGIKAPMTIEDGSLWHSDPGCEEFGQYDEGAETSSDYDNITFQSSRGVWCTGKAWDELFLEPQTNPPPAVTKPWELIGGCRVFYPGTYTTTPDFLKQNGSVGGPNYMMSGNYVFANTGEMTVSNAIVTAGREGVAGDQQEISNPVCDQVRDNLDLDPGRGATFYMEGNSRFTIGDKGALEILRRQQGNDFVSVHATSASTLNYQTPILSTKTGNNKELAIHGVVWAPRSAIEFGLVTNSSVAQLVGGAVVAKLDVSTSASITGFVIEVQGSPQSDKIIFTATATKKGTTKVRVIAQLRFSPPPTGSGVGTWELAMNSWRVCNVTC